MEDDGLFSASTVAQWESGGLITPRHYDRNVAVLIFFRPFELMCGTATDLSICRVRSASSPMQAMSSMIIVGSCGSSGASKFCFWSINRETKGFDKQRERDE